MVNPTVFFDIAVDGAPLGRVCFEVGAGKGARGAGEGQGVPFTGRAFPPSARRQRGSRTPHEPRGAPRTCPRPPAPGASDGFAAARARRPPSKAGCGSRRNGPRAAPRPAPRRKRRERSRKRSGPSAAPRAGPGGARSRPRAPRAGTKEGRVRRGPHGEGRRHRARRVWGSGGRTGRARPRGTLHAAPGAARPAGLLAHVLPPTGVAHLEVEAAAGARGLTFRVPWETPLLWFFRGFAPSRAQGLFFAPPHFAVCPVCFS